MSNHERPVTTEIEVPGANCPWCFNDTIDSLRAEPGVVAVHASESRQYIRVDHEDVDVDRLFALVHQHLRADNVSGCEHVMAPVEAYVGDLDSRPWKADTTTDPREQPHA